MDEPSKATSALIAGIVGILMVPVSVVATPALFFGALLSLYAIKTGVEELGRIKSGELDEDQRAFALAGVGAGGLGCLAQLGGIVLFMVVLLAFVLSL